MFEYLTPEKKDRPKTITRKFHGITPSEARQDGSKLKSFSRISVQIMMKGGSIMDYQIVEKKAFHVLERVETHSIVDSQNKNTIPDFWTRAKKDGTVQKLLEQTSDKTFVYGICYGNNLSRKIKNKLPCFPLNRKQGNSIKI